MCVCVCLLKALLPHSDGQDVVPVGTGGWVGPELSLKPWRARRPIPVFALVKPVCRGWPWVCLAFSPNGGPVSLGGPSPRCPEVSLGHQGARLAPVHGPSLCVCVCVCHSMHVCVYPFKKMNADLPFPNHILPCAHLPTICRKCGSREYVPL